MRASLSATGPLSFPRRTCYSKGHAPLTRYAKLLVSHASGMPGKLCMSGLLTRGDGKNVPGNRGACATRNFTYLVRCPCIPSSKFHWYRKCLIYFGNDSSNIVNFTSAFKRWDILFPISLGTMCDRKFINSLRPSDAIWRQWTWTTLAQVMACCLTAPSHYLNQCWLIIREVLWHTSESSFAGIAQGIDSG